MTEETKLRTIAALTAERDRYKEALEAIAVFQGGSGGIWMKRRARTALHPEENA